MEGSLLTLLTFFTLTKGEGIAFGSVCLSVCLFVTWQKQNFLDKSVDHLFITWQYLFFLTSMLIASSPNFSTNRSEIFGD